MFNFKTIKAKLLVCFGLVLVTMSIVGGILSMSQANRILTERELMRLKEVTAKQVNIVTQKLEKDILLLSTLASNPFLHDSKFTDAERIDFLDNLIEQDQYSDLMLVDNNGQILYNSKNVSLPVEVYESALTGMTAVHGPYGSGENAFLAIGVPVKDMQHHATGVIISFQSLTSLTNNISTNGDNFFILNENGDLIAHTNPEVLSTNANILADESMKQMAMDSGYEDVINIYQSMVDGETGSLEYKDLTTTENILISYAPIDNWSVAYIEPKQTILNSTKRIQAAISLSNLVTTLLGLVFAWMLAHKMCKAISAISSHLKRFEEGDFKSPIPEFLLAFNHEFGTAGRAMESLQNTLAHAIGDIQDSTATITTETNGVAIIAENLLENSKNISAATQEMAQGISAQTSDLVSISQSIETFGSNIERSVQAISKISNKIATVNDVAANSNESTQRLINSVQDIHVAFNDIANKINRLTTTISEVSNITMIIDGISEQTNLLALNASIEAARAGESGKGFAVVAEEIRKLAEQSKASAANINTLIQSISSESASLITGTAEIEEDLTGQVDIMNTSLKDFNAIITNIDEITTAMTTIATGASTILGEKNTIITNVENVTAVSEQLAASTEEVASSTEDITSAAESLTQATTDLSQNTEKVNASLNSFSV